MQRQYIVNIIGNVSDWLSSAGGALIKVADSTGSTVYLCSENKGADQLRGNSESDLRLCFCICKKLIFS